MQKYYITTAIPYINAKPHIGHVFEWFQADTLARFQKLKGKDVAFACGTDENSLKNVQAAEAAGISTQAWLDQYATIFKEAFDFFGIELTHFNRGSDQEKHWPGVQKLWNQCNASDDIYKKTYTGLYCVGCESYYDKADLTADGLCPEHLKAPEEVSEENYFFRLSKYQEQIEELIKSDKLQIVSDQYKNEMLSFVQRGLEDFSVSRSIERARGIGVPVPNDESQAMYVWFDALSVYITAIGFGRDQAEFEKYWPADVHVIGKGINRFHSIYWIGMLLSAKLDLPKTIFVHGYLTANGQKMSKSLGNVIDPFDLVNQYGLEPVRYFLLKHIPSHNDGDFSHEKFVESYTADLSNGIGNVCSRVAKLCEKAGIGEITPSTEFDHQFEIYLSDYDLSGAANWIQTQVMQLDGYLSEKKPWTLTGEEQTQVLGQAVQKILMISFHLQPFMPKTAEAILTHFSAEKITSLQPLFPRIQN
ncbi:MAG: methionine--tRNA ligase [Candidatus Pacebacteria bacterium CG_4_10_14_0_8_um_filter_42_14]|nr:MAG: methionine--tRNA ligase [Candidatus Pacebacteria bacterium CG_4_10_14_0_8_um_filter_42_14]